MNNFEDIANRRVDIREDIQHYQDTLSYTSSKVDYSVGEHLYMLPSVMNLKIRLGTVGYNNKILVSDGKFILGKNDEVNSLETPSIKSHKTNSLGLTHTPDISQNNQEHNDPPLYKILVKVIRDHLDCNPGISLKSSIYIILQSLTCILVAHFT